jgi:hypothetical protein
MINAYLISSSLDKHRWDASRSHFLTLSSRYRKDHKDLKVGSFNVCVIGEKLDESVEATENSALIKVQQSPNHTWDRYININVSHDEILVENDYAGSIPFFYSSRNGFTASNIEPCVYIASDSSLEDISPENIFGYLKYSHFIWDETAWGHIYQMLPDSIFQFTSDGQIKERRYLASVKASTEKANLSGKEVAGQLYELNKNLVTRSLDQYDEIILPLSSGYDSRMIYAVLANDTRLAKRTRCFTYGSEGSIEVEAGRRLSQLKKMKWNHIELPCNFLQSRYTKEIADIFGGSLHMHGMYQIEFYEQIKSNFSIQNRSALTSGFMTGVPAGQHNGLLQIGECDTSLVQVMNRFSQSKTWRDEELTSLPIFNNLNYNELAESRFRAAFDRFDGEIFQKAVIFDVWTRQRNFISYYPRTLEWLTPVVSPHMNSEYANFFMSLNREHLWNRKAVELMFLHHYSDIASVASNSNGVESLGNRFEKSMFFISRVLAKLGISNPLPKRYRNAPFEFDINAIINSQEESFFPLLSNTDHLKSFVDSLGGESFFTDCFKRALSGDTKAYAQIITIQALAFDGLLNQK